MIRDDDSRYAANESRNTTVSSPARHNRSDTTVAAIRRARPRCLNLVTFPLLLFIHVSSYQHRPGKRERTVKSARIVGRNGDYALLDARKASGRKLILKNFYCNCCSFNDEEI